MINKCISFVSRLNFNKLQSRRYVSALYLTGDKAKQNFAILVPYMNFDDVFKNPSKMQNNLKIRGMNINFNELINKYENYKNLKNKEYQLEKQREQIAMTLKTTNFCDDKKNEKEMDKIKASGKLLRKELKNLKEELFPIEEDFIDNFLKLPNEINPKVHKSECTILYCNTSVPTEQKFSKPHTQYSDLIKFKNDSYYLLKEVAIFDTKFPLQCVKYFINKDFNFVQMSNSDFARTILLEAAAINKDKHSIIHEESSENKINLLHLVGGASLLGFLGFIAKTAIFSSNLPLRLIAFGRQYRSYGNAITTSLYEANQTNAVQIFSVCSNRKEAEDEFKRIIDMVIEMYKNLDIHFRVVLPKATEILPAETMRVVIQMYSPVSSNYIDIGHISDYSDFISKRLLFNLRDKKIDNKFPYILSGTIVDSAKLIACLLENGKELSISNYDLMKNKDENTSNLRNVFNE